jgi:ComF family protein
MTAPPALVSLLDILLPRSCALCGSPLLRQADALEAWPLCAECGLGLRPLEGERCPSCGMPLISERGLCMRCRGKRRAFDSVYPLFSYSGSVRELVSAYKKSGRRSLAPFLASLFAQAISERWPERTIVPVPPRPGKIRLSGWDQVEAIAARLETLGLPVARPLERRSSDEQKRLGRGARGANATRAYSLKRGASSPDLPLVIDDVVTTCATIEACSRALREGGARSVQALVLAAD